MGARETAGALCVLVLTIAPAAGAQDARTVLTLEDAVQRVEAVDSGGEKGRFPVAHTPANYLRVEDPEVTAKLSRVDTNNFVT